MLWPFLTFVALAGIALVHYWWRGKFQRAQAASQEEFKKLKQSHELAAGQVQTQQNALFDSMAEGLLLLDETGRIQLANRAFSRLFGVTTEVRSRTIMEALRLHELAELVDTLGTGRESIEHEFRLLWTK